MDRYGRITARGRILPLAILTVVSIAGIYALHRITGGRQLADDFDNLRDLIMRPFVLWGDYRSAGLSDAWGSFPPVLPPLFGLLTRPWFLFLPDFIAFRIGILSWTVVLYLAFSHLMTRMPGVGEKRIRSTLMAFVMMPSVIYTIVVIPQEEIYVAIFALALFVAGSRGRWDLMPFLLILTALAGKYFLLVLIVPLAFASGRTKRNIAVWGGTAAAVLGAYILYHHVAFGLRPILDHVVPYNSSLSIWGLLWNLGLELDPGTAKALSLPILGAAVLTAGFLADRKGLPLQHAFAVTLYITLAFLSITFPGYFIWNIPFVLMCAAMAGTRRIRMIMIGGAFLWGAGEIGANFFRGVHLALSAGGDADKSAIAEGAVRLFGEGFPWQTFHIASLVIVLASGVLTAWLIWKDGSRLSREDGVSRA